VKLDIQKIRQYLRILSGFDLVFRFVQYVASAAIISLSVLGFTFFAAPASAFFAFYVTSSALLSLAVFDFLMRPIVWDQTVSVAKKVVDESINLSPNTETKPRETTDASTQTRGYKKFFHHDLETKNTQNEPVSVPVQNFYC
jgi:hypothetical protein